VADDVTFAPSVFYVDPRAALRWLESAFGFETTMAIEGPADDPTQCHYEMAYRGRGRIMVGAQWNERVKSPTSASGVNTQNVHVQIDEDVDAHCERARAAGAVIVQEPEDQFYGDRTYRALDPEGHEWHFGQHVRDVSRAEAEQAIGQKIEATSWD
jgi:uncharacterized glyoxalase superfamily protein PhnB